MGFENYIEFLIRYFLTSQLYIKFFFCYYFFLIALLFFCIFFDIVKYLSKKHNVKKKIINSRKQFNKFKKKIFRWQN